MAIQLLGYSGTYDFGILNLGESETIQITFTNTSDPDISMNVSLSGLTSEFTYGTGDQVFTLANNGDSRVVDITYTPLAPGNADDTLVVTHNAPNPASPLDIPISAQCEKIFTEYQLPTITGNPAGDMDVYLYLENDVSAPTIPSTVKITSIGTVEELIDFEPGIADVQHMSIEAAEDYSTYSYGFWYHIINSDPTREILMKFILTEDGTDTVYFYGRVKRDDTEWPEHYLSTAEDDRIRTVTIELVSLLDELKTLTIAGTITTLQQHKCHASLERYTVKALLASILTGMTAQTYDEANIHIRNTDIRFKDTLGNIVNAEDITFSGGIDTEGTINAAMVNKGYFNVVADDDNRLHWTYRYNGAHELLKDICVQFGWTCRYFYGQSDGSYAGDATDKHRLEFITRKGVTTVAPAEGVKESTLTSDASQKVAAIRVTDIISTPSQLSWGDPLNYAFDLATGAAWFANDKENAVTFTPYVGFYATPEPAWNEYDMQITCQFIIADLSSPASGYNYWLYRHLFRHDGAGGITWIANAGFYDYIASAWNDDYTNLQNALMSYYARRFTSGRKMFRRRYSSLKFTVGGVDSHTNIKLMQKMTINDGISSDTYYATEVIKDFENNEVTVLWIQE